MKLSLRTRALIGGVISAFAAVGVGVVLLNSYIDQVVMKRFDQALLDRHTQVVVALSYSATNPLRVNDMVFDPGFERPYSGRYWQISKSNGEVFTSNSLLGEALAETGKTAQITVKDAVAFGGEPIRVASQRVTLEDGTEWGVTVAETKVELTAERRRTQQSLFLAFALVGLLGVAGAFVQTMAITRPLQILRADVAQRWERDEELRANDYPDEVSPLVEDINRLLERNREIVSRARRQAADLAHALKTPSAILRNELTALSERELEIDASLDALDRIDAQLSRSLARMRSANSGFATKSSASVNESVQRFAPLFSAVAERAGKTLQIDCVEDHSVRMDSQDLEEVLGNILDNAVKWSNSQVNLSAAVFQGTLEILVEDDGPGIPEEAKREALRSGGRLDCSTPGSGLGLAIATDILQAYGARLELGVSKGLGGLAARIILPDTVRIAPSVANC